MGLVPRLCQIDEDIMKYGASLLVLSTALLSAHAAQAQDTNFSRDRNIAAGDRIPTEYEPRGLRWGAFDVSPSLNIGLNSNDNIYYSEVDETSDTYIVVTPQVRITSDWGRHQLTGLLRASSTSYSDHDSENTSTFEAALAGRLDVHGRSNLFGGINFAKSYEPRYDPSNDSDLAEPIEYDTLLTNAGFVAEGNRLRFTGQVTLTDYDYKSVLLKTGALRNEDDRDYKSFTYSGRADYALSPDTAFYVILTGNDRSYDQTDVTDRDSNGYDASVGASFDLTNLIRGEAQIGFLKQEYENPLYGDVDGLSFTANVDYFPTQLITVTASAGRSVRETWLLEASGYTDTEFTLGVKYELLRTLLLSSSVGYTTDDFNGITREDKVTRFDLGAKYLLNRNVVVRAGYTYMKNDSTGLYATPYTDNAFSVSLSLQY
jgi:hypothetical protein